jgi:hypothetical protein
LIRITPVRHVAHESQTRPDQHCLLPVTLSENSLARAPNRRRANACTARVCVAADVVGDAAASNCEDGVNAPFALVTSVVMTMTTNTNIIIDTVELLDVDVQSDRFMQCVSRIKY